MADEEHITCRDWDDVAYRLGGFSSQRLYPNEELLRFFGRHYFPLTREQRRSLRVLEVGCGSGANLWMIAREGIEADGIDLSAAAIAHCADMLALWQSTAMLELASMTAIPYPDRHFDVIVDVFASYYLAEAGFERFLNEVARLLHPGGRFFSYTPSKASDAFRNAGASRLLDASTLDGISRHGSAFFENRYPFRFMDFPEYAKALNLGGLAPAYSERVGRTYRQGAEYFEWLVIEAKASYG